MSATETSSRRDAGAAGMRAGFVRRDETKLSFLTTEFWAMIAAIIGILYAADEATNFDADRAWTLIAAVVIGYMVSRGLAKSGSAHRDRDSGDSR